MSIRENEKEENGRRIFQPTLISVWSEAMFTLIPFSFKMISVQASVLAPYQK